MTLRRLPALASLCFAMLVAACGGGSGRGGTDLAVSASGPTDAVISGSDVVFVMTVSNIGENNATDVSIVNVIGNQLALTGITCAASNGATCPEPSVAMSVPELPRGGVLTFQVSATVTQGANGVISDTLTANYASDVDRSNNSATASGSATSNNVAVTASAPAGPLLESSTTFTMVVSNSGPSDASNVSITNTLSANLTLAAPIACVPAGGASAAVLQDDGTLLAALLPVNGTLTCDVPVTIAQDFSGTVFSTFSVSAAGDARTGDNSATASVGATLTSNVNVTATAPSGPLIGGQSSTFTMVVGNAGPATAFDVDLSTTLSANLSPNGSVTCTADGGAVAPTPTTGGTLRSPSLPVGGTLTCAVPVTVTAGTNGTVSASLTASTTGDERTGDNTDTASVSALSSNLGVSQAGATQVGAGSTATFTATLANPGPSAASNVQLVWTHTDAAGLTFGTPTCVGTGGAVCPTSFGPTTQIGSLAAGRSLIITYAVQTSDSYRGNIVNTLAVSADEDIDASNNTATTTTTAIDGRNGSYKAYAADGRAYDLTIDFDALTYTMSGNGQSVQRTFTFDSATGDYVVGGTARLRTASDLIVGGHDFGGGPKPFLAARVFSTNVAQLAGSYDLATLNVADGSAAVTHAGTARVSGNVLQVCQSDMAVVVTQNCDPAALKSFVVTASGDDLIGVESNTGEVYSFRLARSGASQMLLSAGTAQDGTRQWRIGLPDAAALSGGTLRGATAAGEWVSVTLGGTSYAVSGGAAPDGATLARIAAGGPFSMLKGLLNSNNAPIFVLQANPVAVVVGSFDGTPNVSGLLQLVLP